MNDTATTPDTATMQRFDCPTHSGPLVVLEGTAKDCCPRPSTWMGVHGWAQSERVRFPVILPAECLRNRPRAVCVMCGKVGQPLYATRPYVEEGAPA